MTPEMRLLRKIQIYCGTKNCLAFHQNVGSVKMADGRFFSTGMPQGWPDMIILTNNGKAIFCEVKVHPNRPTKEQINTIRVLTERGFLAFVAYSLDEFIEMTKNVL